MGIALCASVFAGGAGCGSGSPTDTKPATEIAALGPQQPARVLKAKVIGRVAADQRIDLVLGLKLGRGDTTAVEATYKRLHDPSSTEFGHVFTPAEFGDRFAMVQPDYDAMLEHLTSLGFTVSQATPSRTTVSVYAPASVVEKVFGTELLVYQDSSSSVSARRNQAGNTFYAPSASFSLDGLGEYADQVVGISGLDDAGRWQSRMVPGGGKPGATPGDNPLDDPQTPAQLRTRYGVDGVAGADGTGETVALLGTGYPVADSDLDGFVTKFGLADWRTHYIQAIIGGDSRNGTQESGQEQIENTLDADMVLGVAPAASVVHVFVASNAGGLFEDGVAFVVNQVPQAHQASVSYGTCERLAIYTFGQLNAVFMQAEMQGQTWFFSSGDHGTDTCEDDVGSAVLTVDWPASSPYVFGVGGTQINDGNGTEEAWGLNGGGGGGGGGQSELFPKPSWQAGIGPYPNDGARDVPDVSALAGSPGVYIYINGDAAEEGTSAASPIFASIWSLLDQSRGSKGMPTYHERVYGLATGANPSPAFTDVTVGNNSDGATASPPGYNAVAGYDLATGWGSPLLNKLIGALP